MPKRKRWFPPKGRMSETACRTALRQVLRDLSSKNMKLTGAQRFKLHGRVEKLQDELRLIEIEKLEREEAAQKTAHDARPRITDDEHAKYSHSA